MRGNTNNRWVLAAGMSAAVAALAALVVVPAFGENTWDPPSEIACQGEYQSEADAGLATYLADNGYECTSLLNKGQLPAYEHVGELWFKRSATVLEMRTIVYGDANTGFSDEKVCLDDDTDPIEDIAPGGDLPVTCVGNDAAQKASQGGDGGPSYPPAKSASSGEKDGTNEMELFINSLTEVENTHAGVATGGWNVNLGPDVSDLYEYVIPHFNQGGISIVGYASVTVATAVADVAETDEDTPTTIDVLANDVGDLTVTDVTQPNKGVVTVTNAGGDVEFDPNGEFEALNVGDSEEVSFSYDAEDVSGSTDSATVTVTVTGVNDAPVAASTEPIPLTTDEDTTSDPVTLATDVDNPDTDLTIACDSSDLGTFTDEGNGAVSFDPDPNEFGEDTVSCTVSDGTASTAITVSLTVKAVNDPPDAVDDSASMDDRIYDTVTDSPVPNTESFDVVANDTDVDDHNADLSVDVGTPTIDGQGYTGATVGTASLDATDPRSIEFTPDIVWPDDVFSYVVSIPYAAQDDDGATDAGSEATLELTVFRVVCSDETVSDSDGDFVSGSFTNVTPNSCKWYEVIAYEDDVDPLLDTVTFVTPEDGDPSDPADDVYFLGELTFSPESLVDGGETIGLEVDIDGDGTYEPMELCLGDYEVLTDPRDYEGDPFPPGDRWCWYRMEGFAVDGELAYRYFIYGSIDPTFKRL